VRIYTELENQIKIFTSLRLETLDRLALEKQLREIGKLRLAEGRTRFLTSFDREHRHERIGD